MINFCDLGLPHKSESKIWEAKRLVSSNGYILGTEVNDFEDEFARYCESKHSIGVATGCDALLWAMEAWESVKVMKLSRWQTLLSAPSFL